MSASGKSLGQVTLKKLLWGRWVRNLRAPVTTLSASRTSLSLQGMSGDAFFSVLLSLSSGDRKLGMLAGMDSGDLWWLSLARKILKLQPVPQEGLAVSFSSLSGNLNPSPASSNGQTRVFPVYPSSLLIHVPTLSLYIFTSAFPWDILPQP